MSFNAYERQNDIEHHQKNTNHIVSDVIISTHSFSSGRGRYGTRVPIDTSFPTAAAGDIDVGAL